LNSPTARLFQDIKLELELNFKNITDINNLILKYFIIKDKSDDFYNYLKYKNCDDKNIRIDQDIFNNIIKYDPKNISHRCSCLVAVISSLGAKHDSTKLAAGRRLNRGDGCLVPKPYRP
jgi:hypothetical protein